MPEWVEEGIDGSCLSTRSIWSQSIHVLLQNFTGSAPPDYLNRQNY